MTERPWWTDRTADHVAELLCKSASEPFRLIVGEVLRFHDDAVLGAGEGEVYDGALPARQHREADTLVPRDARMVVETALVRAAAAVVLGPVPRVDLDRSIVAFEWERHLLNLRSTLEALEYGRIDVDVGCGVLEL